VNAVLAVQLLRGAVLVPALVRAAAPNRPFWIWSSAICLAIGAVHLVGVVQRWQTPGA
jgi:hypothetical protein